MKLSFGFKETYSELLHFVMRLTRKAHNCFIRGHFPLFMSNVCPLNYF